MSPRKRYAPLHFVAQEFVPKALYEKLGDAALAFMDEGIMIACDHVREYFGVPVTINDWHRGGNNQWRGLRTMQCTIGAPNSMHRLGKACDLILKGVSAEVARREILSHREIFYPHIRRMEDDVTWLHIDNKDTGVPGIHLFKA